jgi:hypothetical protein
MKTRYSVFTARKQQVRVIVIDLVTITNPESRKTSHWCSETCRTPISFHCLPCTTFRKGHRQIDTATGDAAQRRSHGQKTLASSVRCGGWSRRSSPGALTSSRNRELSSLEHVHVPDTNRVNKVAQLTVFSNVALAGHPDHRHLDVEAACSVAFGAVGRSRRAIRNVKVGGSAINPSVSCDKYSTHNDNTYAVRRRRKVFLLIIVFFLVLLVLNAPNAATRATCIAVWSMLMGSVSRVEEWHLRRSTSEGIWRAAGDGRAGSVAAAHGWRRDERACVVVD